MLDEQMVHCPPHLPIKSRKFLSSMINRTLIVRPAFSRCICTLSTANLTSLISAHIENKRLTEARKLVDRISTSQNTTTWNQMINAYIQNDKLQHAHELFVKMPDKDTVSWNTMLSVMNKTKNPLGVYRYFLEMRRSGLRLTEHTISTVVTAVLHSVFDVLVSQVHALAVSLGLNLDVFVGSALVRGYASLKDQDGLRRAFDEISVKNVASWNMLVSGYMELGCTSDAQKVFDAMPEKDIVTSTIMINGYILNKKTSRARFVFDEISEKNVFSWTAMISGYVQNGKFLAGLKLFQSMMESGTRPNNFTFSSVLNACAGSTSLLVGKQVHVALVKLGIPNDVILLTSLMDMYAKCGDIDAAICTFESMPMKNLVSWNSVIGGCARHGLGKLALDKFEKMIESGLRPDQVTIVNVLSACGHAGLVEEGERQFTAMKTKYGILPEKEHYACMVDLYGRAGELEKAEKLIREMPFEPDVIIWGALLGACGMHSCSEFGELAAKGISKLKSDHPATYSVFSRIYGETGEWSTSTRLKDMMTKKRVKKQKAGSWVEASSSEKLIKSFFV